MSQSVPTVYWQLVVCKCAIFPSKYKTVTCNCKVTCLSLAGPKIWGSRSTQSHLPLTVMLMNRDNPLFLESTCYQLNLELNTTAWAGGFQPFFTHTASSCRDSQAVFIIPGPIETSGISTDNKWERNLDVVLVYETCYDNIWGILSVQGILWVCRWRSKTLKCFW